MINAFQKDQALLEDINNAPSQKDSLSVWWLGQSGFLIKYQSLHFLFDPYLSNSLTQKYASTDKPHIRMSELVIQPQRLSFIDAVSSSHNHTDHLDGATLIPIIEANPEIKFFIPEANRAFVVNRIQCAEDWPIGMTQGTAFNGQSFQLHAISAAHNERTMDENGNCHFLGYVLQCGSWAIYHSGDTLWHDQLLEELSPYDIDIALLPINGNKPERRVAGNLNFTEAAELGKALDATTIPCHYHMFEFNTEDPNNFRNAAEKLEAKYTILRIGEKKIFTK